ncbi:UNVERIFIED_CONTAM: hypothetical protein GTU68_039219 [Idotea baltica]|nr:hypothetical protein [Idotea baltica]
MGRLSLSFFCIFPRKNSDKDF